MMAGEQNDNVGGNEANPNQINGNDSDAEVEDESNITPEEYDMLNSKLDELNSALDLLEKKNDDIHAQLVELLRSNREVREQLHKENTQGSSEERAE